MGEIFLAVPVDKERGEKRIRPLRLSSKMTVLKPVEGTKIRGTP